MEFLNEIVQSRRQDNFFLDKEENQCFIVDRLDIAVPRDARIAEKEKEKTENYQDLKRQISTLWTTKAYVVLVVVGALVMIPKNLNN